MFALIPGCDELHGKQVLVGAVERVRPFIDGNGLASRLLLNLILA